MGGVGGALARHAEQTLARLGAESQAAVRAAFRHLVTPEGTRQVLRREELVERVGAEAPIESLVEARLLSVTEDGGVEIVHEALLVAWPRLAEWRREDEGGARRRAQLRAAARTWDEQGRPGGLLWRGAALAEPEPAELSLAERAFYQASRREEGRARRTRRVAVGLIVAVLVATSVVLFVLRRNADRRLTASYEEQGRQLLLAGEPLRGLAYLGEALARGDDGPVVRFLVARGLGRLASQRGILRRADTVRAIALSPDGRTAAIGSEDGKLALWDLEGAPTELVAHDGPIRAVAFAPDGRTVATAGRDGRVRVWTDGRRTLDLAHGGKVDTVQFAPDGRLLASAGEGGVRLWSLPDGQPAGAPIAGKHVLAVDVGEGRLLAASLDGEAVVWDLATRVRIATLADRTEALTGAFFAGHRTITVADDRVAVWSDGQRERTFVHARRVTDAAASGDRLATGSSDGVARIWSLESGALLAQLPGKAELRVVRFCGADVLVTAATDGNVTAWDARTGRQLESLAGHLEFVWALDCAGDVVVTGSVDRTARSWHLGVAGVPARQETGAPLNSVDVVGEKLVTASATGETTLWTLGETGPATPTHRLSLPGAGAATARLSRDGRRVVVADHLGQTALVFDADSGALVRRLGPHTGAGKLWSVDVTADGARVVTAGHDSTAVIWDVATGERLATLAGHAQRVVYVSLDPAGERVVTASLDRTARVWNARTGETLAILAEHSAQVTSACFDHRGERLATTSSDRTARVWSGGRVEQILEGHTRDVMLSAFSPDDRILATAGADERVILWDVASGRILLDETRHADEVSGLAFAGRDRLLSAGADGQLLVWDVAQERRSPAEIATVLACRVPFALSASGKLTTRALTCPPR